MFLKLTGREKMLFLEAFLLHLWVGLVLKFVPFRRLPRMFGSPQPAAGNQLLDILMIKRAVERANVVSPWRNRCLVSSLVARNMLKRRNIPSQLSLGVSKDAGGRTVAHSWLSSGNIEVTGKQGDFQELFVY
jgi:hypothetical protein